MSLKKITEAAVRVIRDLPTRPTGPTGRYSAAQLQAFFDKAAQNIRETFNELVSKLESSDGAAEIGFSETENVHGANVQAAIENVQEQVRSAYEESAIPDGAVTGDKILAGSLLVNVTSAVNLTCADAEPQQYVEKDIRFYYCRALGIVFVRGMIKNILVRRVGQGTGYDSNVDLNFSVDAYEPNWILSDSFNELSAVHAELETFGKVFSATVEATGDELIHIGSRDERINSYLEDLEWDEYPMSLYLSGWYRCDGA